MLQMDLPHVNVLTKIDNLHSYGPLAFNLDFYTQVQDLSYLLPRLADESPMFANSKFEGLNRAICELVEDFALVQYETLAVEDKKSMMNLLHAIDRAGGYAFGGAEGANDTIWQVAVRQGATTMDIHNVQERWLDAKEEWDEKEKRDWEEEAKARAAPVGDDSGGPGVGMNVPEQGDDELGDIEQEAKQFSDNGIKVVRKS